MYVVSVVLGKSVCREKRFKNISCNNFNINFELQLI